MISDSIGILIIDNLNKNRIIKGTIYLWLGFNRIVFTAVKMCALYLNVQLWHFIKLLSVLQNLPK